MCVCVCVCVRAVHKSELHLKCYTICFFLPTIARCPDPLSSTQANSVTEPSTEDETLLVLRVSPFTTTQTTLILIKHFKNKVVPVHATRAYGETEV